MYVYFFETDKFNLTEEGENFINPCCFGEDFASWLKSKLENAKISVDDIYQEDWGWEISCSDEEQAYYLGVGGIRDKDNSNLGEWRIMFTRRRKFMDYLFGKNKISKEERIFGIINSILQDAGFSNIRLEEME